MHRFPFLLALVLSLFSWKSTQAQSSEQEVDAFFLRDIYDHALTEGSCYPWLMYLSEQIGGRLSGTPQAAAAVEYTRQMLDTLGLDTVWLQPCMVPRWVRGDREIVRVSRSIRGSFDLRALALGNSIGTGPGGLAASILEVHSLDTLEKLGEAAIRGKIVFFNRPMDPKQINTFSAYGGAVDQRVFGASRAARYGARAVLVRSMTTRIDPYPHTGVNVYEEGVDTIPALAISTEDAELLSELLKQGDVEVYIRNTSHMLPDVLSYNVIGEIRGSEHPDEIILVGGHLDSWDIGTGAHDDGAGCVQAMDVLHILRRMDYQPKRTLRCVLFMNEENGMRGARAYQDASYALGEYHLAAMESDRGGFTPRGFTVEGHETVFREKFSKVLQWLPLLESYGLSFRLGGSGADISGLKDQKGLFFGFDPDSQRYFDYHHAQTDLPDVVNKRELELGAAAMTALVYLLDKYGL